MNCFKQHQQTNRIKDRITEEEEFTVVIKDIEFKEELRKKIIITAADDVSFVDIITADLTDIENLKRYKRFIFSV